MLNNKITFNNIPNPELKVSLDGKEETIWYSRSLAFLVYYIVVTNDDIFVLVNKRGEMIDKPGKWSMPCGYIDWNETLPQAVRREIYEENGVDIFDESFYDKELASNLYGPHQVDTSITNSRQNFLVSIYHVVRTFNNNLPILTHEYSNGEAVECKWINMKELLITDDSEWAFNHKEKIEFFINNLIQTNFNPII